MYKYILVLLLLTTSAIYAQENITIEKSKLNKEELAVLNTMNKVYIQNHIDRIYFGDSVLRYYKVDSAGKTLYLTEAITHFRENTIEFTTILQIFPEKRHDAWNFKYEKKSETDFSATGNIEYHSNNDFTRTESKCDDVSCETTIWNNEKVVFTRSEKLGNNQ
ncbi:MAG: hypothetical protein WCG87_04970 [Bacteroidota bacterium]